MPSDVPRNVPCSTRDSMCVQTTEGGTIAGSLIAEKEAGVEGSRVKELRRALY